MKVKLVLLIIVLLISSESVMALGLPTRLYPAKVIKKTIQVVVKKVAR